MKRIPLLVIALFIVPLTAFAQKTSYSIDNFDFREGVKAEQPAAAPIPDFAAEALAVLLQLEYKRAEAERMIAATLKAMPAIANAETLLAAIYRGKKDESAP